MLNINEFGSSNLQTTHPRFTTLITIIQPKITLFIDVLASRQKPSSGLTSGAGRQYVKACPIRGLTGSSPRLDLCCRSSWCMGQAFTYWRPAPKSVLMKASDVKLKRR